MPMQPPVYRERVVVQTDGGYVDKFMNIKELAEHRNVSRFDSYKPLLEARERLSHLEWIIGKTIPFPRTATTYCEFVADYGKFALTLLHEAVGQIPDLSGMPESIRLMVYRFRRCFPSFPSRADPLDFLGAYSEVREGPKYTSGEMHDILTDALKGRGFTPKRVPFRAFFSNKGTMEYPGKEGGFNKSVITLMCGSAAELPKFDFHDFSPNTSGKLSFGDDMAHLYQYSPCGQLLADRSRRDKQYFYRAFLSSYRIMKNIGRKPCAFMGIIDERSLKKRIPALAEGFCSILSQGISDIGKTIQTRLFPLTKGGAIKMKKKEGSIYLSGDYADATAYILWEAIVVGYYHIFRFANLSVKEFEMYMEIVKFLAGEYTFYSTSSDRDRYREIFKYRTKIIHPKFGFDTYAYACKHGDVQPIVSKPVATGSIFGKLGKLYSEPPSFDEILLGLQAFQPLGRTITTQQGALMALSIAAPALHIVGAIPHWKFDKLQFCITGDDNASRHDLPDPMASIMKLEAEKNKTGMKPHDLQKSAQGPKGFLLAERLMLVKDSSNYLVEVKNFPIRVLFPDVLTEWHALSMPEAVFRNLKEITDEAVADRIVSYVYWKFKSTYDKLETLGITVFGPNGIFPCYPPTPGALNGPGGFAYKDVFKLPSIVSSEYNHNFAFALLCPPVSIPYEEDEQSGDPRSNKSPTLDGVIDSLRSFTAVSSYEEPIISSNTFSLIAVVTKNIRNLTDVRPIQGAYSEFSMFGHFLSRGNDKSDRVFPSNDNSLAVLHEEKRVKDLLNSKFGIIIPGRYTPKISRSPIMLITQYYDCLLHGYRTPVSHFTSTFKSNFPNGSTLLDLSKRAFHWFIDLANCFPFTCREADGIYSINEYARFLRCPAVPPGTTIYLVCERPGLQCMALFSRSWVRKHVALSEDIPPDTICVIRCHPRIAGHAGADLEFRNLTQILTKLGVTGRELYYSSRDRDWSNIGRLTGATFVEPRSPNFF